MSIKTFMQAVACLTGLLFYHFLNPGSVLAQECNPADIVLSSQAEVDAFQANHGPCDRVSGDLKVEGDDVVSLAGLSDVEEIYQLNIWRNPLLKDLQGMSGLKKASHLSIFGNPSIISLQGMASLEDLNDLYIAYNEELPALQGLESVGLVTHLRIRGNSSLQSLQGLSNLSEVIYQVEISGNNALTSLDGLESLSTLRGELIIEDNTALANIDGLSSLSSLASEGQCSIRIQRNDSLTNLAGLSSLTEVPCSLIIHLNDALSDLSGLHNLVSVGQWLHIAANPSLANLAGLHQLKNVGALGLINNESLSDVSALSGLQTIYHYLEITSNPSLSDLVGLTSLTSVGVGSGMMSGILIRDNHGLQSLYGLSTVQAASRVYIERNPLLADCLGVNLLIDPIDDYEPGPGPGVAGIPDVTHEVSFTENAAGCNSVNESLAQAPITQLNAGLNDAWFNSETDGQGFLITVFPEIGQLFMAWFTYDTERPHEDFAAILGEPGHRWLTAHGEYIENFAELTLYVTTGGVFDSEQPKPETEPYGVILLEFSTCNAGTVSYDMPSIFQTGSIPIERIALDNVPLCYLLEHQKLGANPSRD